MTETHVFDDRPCLLGEGPFWHPKKQQLFWFDIMRKRLMTRNGSDIQEWQFDRFVSAAGWVGGHQLLIASSTDLMLFDLVTGGADHVVPLEADNPVTRSNDGRADPWGGFWIGTMGIRAEPVAGAIYRYYRGELRCLFPGLTITNGIAFSPDHRFAYFADTAPGKVWRQPLDITHGWPEGEAELFLDHGPDGPNPDGAAIDQNGNYWSAEWGRARVSCYALDGRLLRAIEIPASQGTCPAFGGTDLYVTSARQGLSADALQTEPQAGAVFVAKDVTMGQKEYEVIL